MSDDDRRRLSQIRRSLENRDRFDGRPFWLNADVAFLLEQLSVVVTRFAEAILHGDNDHRAWLLDAAKAFGEGAPLPEMRGNALGDTPVRIWSGQWEAYWRPGGIGYTAQKSEAWVTTLREAVRQTQTCGPEKRLSFEPVKDHRPGELSLDPGKDAVS